MVNQAHAGEAACIDKGELVVRVFELEDKLVESGGPLLLGRLLGGAVMRHGVVFEMDPSRHAWSP